MPVSLHNEFIRAKVLGAKFRFGRPNFFQCLKTKKQTTTGKKRWDEEHPRRTAFCLLRGFFDFHAVL